MNVQKKTKEVVAAIILRDGKLFAAKRKAKPVNKPLPAEAGFPESGDTSGWEFPGGKIEPGELPEDALKREIREELATEIEVGDLLTTIEYDYPKFHLTMHCYLCSDKAGFITGENICIDGGMTKQMIYHAEHGWTLNE